MNGKTILDTTVVIRIFNNDSEARQRIASLELYLPSVVVGELVAGASKSGRIEQNLQRIEDFAASAVVLPVDMETARVYGGLKFRLRQKGKPIPENDIWIASLAIQHDLPLASHDMHFAVIEGLKFESW